MSATTCIVCSRPMPDTAYACTAETARAAEQLRTIADMTPAARDVAHGFSRRGGGGASGKPGSRLPLDLGATSKLDAVQGELTTLARHISEERGVQIPPPVWPDFDPITVVAGWLPLHLDWLRHRQEVDEALATIAAAARVVAGIARGPADQRFLGPCGAPAQVEVTTITDTEPCYVDGQLCDGDVYAREGSSEGRCRLCGAKVGTAERRAWLDDEVRAHAFRAMQISQAYGVNVNTIRSWALRGRIPSYWRTNAGLVAVWTDPPEGETRERLHYVGDVLDLAAADAARRETERATRERRTAALAATSEGAAA